MQVYGKLGRVRYNLAMQNGGHKSMRDLNSDKAWIAEQLQLLQPVYSGASPQAAPPVRDRAPACEPR